MFLLPLSLVFGYNPSRCVEYVYQENTFFHRLCKNNLGFDWFDSVWGFPPLVRVLDQCCVAISGEESEGKVFIYLVKQFLQNWFRCEIMPKALRCACYWDQPACPYLCGRWGYELWDPDFFAPLSSSQCNSLFLEGRKGRSRWTRILN